MSNGRPKEVEEENTKPENQGEGTSKNKTTETVLHWYKDFKT